MKHEQQKTLLGGEELYACWLKHLKYAAVFTVTDTIVYNILTRQIRLMNS